MEVITTAQTHRRPPVLSGLSPYTGMFGREEITHLLKRVMFGSKKSDIDFFVGKTLDQAIATLIVAPLTQTAPPVNNYNNPTANPPVIDPDIPAGSTWVWGKENGNLGGRRRDSLRGWWIGNMVNQEKTIFEKMVLFWHNHFATESVETSPILMYHHVAMLRRNALGNFKKFIKDVTFDPNMLRYLNGYLNKRTAPDENYARELQELFTLGKGPDSKYTEEDVKAAAKVLTGWSFRNQLKANTTDQYEYVTTFNANNHDTSAKKFSSFYGGKSITGRTDAAGAEKEFDEMLDMIFEKEEVAKFICRRIYNFFVYYEIDTTTEANIIVPLANIFRQNNYEIAPVLKALFSSEHFFDVANRGCLIKSPLEYVVGISREFGMQFPNETDITRQYSGWNVLGGERYGAVGQGQHLGNPPNVSGWPAYYQAPSFHEFWINTDSFPRRIRFAEQFLTNTGINLGNSKALIIDVLGFTNQFGTDAEDPNKLIDASLKLLYRTNPSNKFKGYLKDILLSGQSSDYYWTDAWNAYKTNPTTTNINTVKSRLQIFYKLIVNQPDFHLS